MRVRSAVPPQRSLLGNLRTVDEWERIFARQSNESNDDYLERLFRLPI